MSEWQPIEAAPKDGTEVFVPINIGAQLAYWCKDLQRWVLSRPLHIDFAYPTEWRPAREISDAPDQQTPQEPK